MIISQEEKSWLERQKQWNWLAEQLEENIDGFKIVQTEDKFGIYQYYWKCRNEKGEVIEAKYWHETKKQCLEDFFSEIQGFWMKGVNTEKSEPESYI